MSSRVGTLHAGTECTGRPRPVSVRRLDRLAAEQLPDELEPALAAFGAEEAVYVVRRVHARTTVNLTTTSDMALAHRWGRDLGRSVAMAIANDPGDGTNLVRFASDAEFVASFVADMLAGTAWQRWYFGAFSRHRSESAARAVEAVLVEHRHDLAAVLAELRRRGLLETLLAAIDATVLGLHGASASQVTDRPDEEGWRPLVAASMQIVSALGLWAAAPDPGSVLHRWAGTGRQQPDWRDSAALTDAVVAIITWLVRTGAAHAPRPQDTARPDAAKAGLDWLDSTADHRARGSAVGSDRGRPSAAAERRGDATAAQHVGRAGAGDPRPAVGAGRLRTDRHRKCGRLLAALAASEPAWGEDPLALVLIERMLAAWEAVITAREPRRVIEAVAAADPVAAMAAWEGTEPGTGDHPLSRRENGAVREALASAAQLGESAAWSSQGWVATPRLTAATRSRARSPDCCSCSGCCSTSGSTAWPNGTVTHWQVRDIS